MNIAQISRKLHTMDVLILITPQKYSCLSNIIISCLSGIEFLRVQEIKAISFPQIVKQP